MQKLFFGIYGAILLSTLFVLALSYGALSFLNQYRYQTHLEDVMEGTLVLISRGVLRQEAENKERWLNLASSLLDADLTTDKSAVRQNRTLEIRAAKSTSNIDTEKYIGLYQPASQDLQIQLEFAGVTEHILTATAFFMLNEIGRLQPEQRQAHFDQLTRQFNYPVFRARMADLELDSRQQERLQRGETVVALQRQLGQGLAFNVYAPWGKTSDALVLGPIAFFDPFPGVIATSVLALTLLLMAIVVMSIIRNLSKRLMALQDEVDAIRPEFTSEQQGPANAELDSGKGNDKHANDEVITGLSNKIQSMAKRIEKLLEEKAYMIRAVSHDLRTPIAKIHFRLEALTEKVGADHKLIRGCHDDLRQLNLLIDELLTYEKLSVAQSIELNPLNLDTIIQEEIESVKVLFPHLSIELTSPEQPKTNEITADINLLEINGNRILLSRLFENLLQNAGRHARQQIDIAVHTSQDALTVTIDDDGEGLDDAAIPRLFEPFFRTDASRSKSGYGLGLAIVKQVVMQHHGKVSAGNNGNGGASFRLTFDRRVEEQ